MTKSELASVLQHRRLSARELARTAPNLAAMAGEHDVDDDRPIEANPAFAPMLDAARVLEIGALARLADAKIDAVAALVRRPSAVSDSTLSRLVSQGTLDETQARELGLATALYQLADGDMQLAGAIRSSKGGGSTRELARRDVKGWQQALGARSDLEMAQRLADRFAVLHPVDAFVGRLPHTAGDRTRALVDKAHAIVGDRLLALDFSPESTDLAQLDARALGATEGEHARLVDTLKMYQRSFVLTRHVDDAHRMLAAGMRGAAPVAKTSIAEFAHRTGIPLDRAEGYWRKARRTLAETSQALGSILDTWGGLFGELRVGEVTADARDYLKRLPGYAALFGNLDYCACEHCESVLGPAAYFVDLMTYVTDNILGQFTALVDHPLDLKVRRPDLWSLDLTCKNTDERVPTLALVAEVLERYIARDALAATAAHTAVETAVYQRILPAARGSFAQPFHLTLARIAGLLGELGSSRTEVTDAMTGGMTADDAVAAAELGVSFAEWQLLLERVTTANRIATLYDLPLAQPGALDRIDVQELVRATGLSREELGELVATDFIGGAGSQVAIVAQKRGADSIQNDIERLAGASIDALDRMHRFTRLRRALPWTTAELDHVLTALDTTVLDVATLHHVASVRAVQRRLDGPVDEMCALFGSLPEKPSGASLFDRIFNPPDLPRAKYPPSGKTAVYLPWLHRAETNPDIPRLLSGLGVSLEELTSLQRHLRNAIDVDDDPARVAFRTHGKDGHFLLTPKNLTLLYRHARLAQRLRLSIDELFQLIGFADIGHVVSGLRGLTRLLDLHAWWRTSGLSLDDIAVALRSEPRDPTRYLPARPTAIAKLAVDIVTGGPDALAFQDTLFAVALGVTEPASRAILEANDALVETFGTRWRVRAGVDLMIASVRVPDIATVRPPDGTATLVTDKQIRDALLPFVPSRVLAARLGTVLNADIDKITALARIAGHPLDSLPLADALATESATSELLSLLTALRPLAAVFATPVWDAPAIDLVRAHPEYFELSLPTLAIDGVRALSVYARIAGKPPGVLSPTEDASLTHRAAVRDVLLSFDRQSGRFRSTSDAAISAVLGVDRNFVAGLRDRLATTQVAATALDRLDAAARVCAKVGVEAAALAAIAGGGLAATALDDEVEHELVRAADALRLALRRRDRDDTEHQATLARIDEPLRERRRDALVAYLLHSTPGRPWRTADELSDYFLIDVATGGCAMTSRVVSATQSVQRYVQRVILHLEQTRPNAPHPLSLHLDEPAASEWCWRKNYRVWEANRKIFLWPENYIEPDLRDDKTPLFEELETELLQTDLDEQAVIDAYAKYLTGFEELASLTIAGAYHDIDPKPRTDEPADVLHLFGTAPTDPPTYYYRTCEDLLTHGDTSRTPLWSAWRKVEVQIPGRYVSPVVFQNRLHLLWTKIVTRSINRQVEQGTSYFDGYNHKMMVQLATLRPDGTWTAPQSLRMPGADVFKPGSGFSAGEGVVEDRNIVKRDANGDDHSVLRLKYGADVEHIEAVDGYTLFGPNWEWLWPEPARDAQGREVLAVTFRNFSVASRIDVFRRIVDPPRPVGRADGIPDPFHTLAAFEDGLLYRVLPSGWQFNASSVANLVLDYPRLDELVWEGGRAGAPLFDSDPPIALARLGLHPDPKRRNLLAIPGAPDNAILQFDGDLLLLQSTESDDYVLTRIGTTGAQLLARTLFTGGLDALLALPLAVHNGRRTFRESQQPLRPPTAGGALVGIADKTVPDEPAIDYLTGSYRTYYEELFFHIPFTIANALNARGRYAEAQRWYHYIFDPTRGRIWRYIGFDALTRDKLRDTLRDEQTLRVYHEDPGNPHAIARLRPTAFQKAIVMKYVDNLLDWGDHLFTQFTMESVNEAQQLYSLAAEILGRRPARLGDCGEAQLSPRSFERIAPEIGKDEDILIELETVIEGGKAKQRQVAGAQARLGIDARRLRDAVRTTAVAPQVIGDGVTDPPGALFRGLAYKRSRTAAWGPPLSSTARGIGDRLAVAATTTTAPNAHPIRALAASVTKQLSPIFCFPANPDLLAYWDRVEDRLYKIRHCLDIDGRARELALFAPEIDPRLLVQARADGLSFEDVLGATSGSLPPYRFQYLIDRAKGFAASLSSFGAALLAGMEKRDGEQLARVRLVQQQNLSRMTTQLRRWEIEVAQEAYQTVERQQEAAEYRRDYFASLIDQNRNSWEIAQSVAQHSATASQLAGLAQQVYASIAALGPQVGSPFALTYGGIQLGASWHVGGYALRVAAAASESIGRSAALEAGFDRRSEGWEHQRQLAIRELRQLDRNLRAADYRRKIAQRSLELHEKSIEQLDELLELTDGKFSNRGLYDWMVTKLRRIYRDGYNNVLALARLAEQAFRFERGDETAPRLEPTYWDPVHAGLLAGEQLLIGLEGLERRFLETNYRSLEVDQAFALSQVSPEALVALREDGECRFLIPEIAFDLFYPGQYKRRIRAVRLTIPCITGPYVNVSATLALDQSWLRAAPDGDLTPVPPRRSVAIAASTAQNDAGVFELSFRDERYMPFEGAGAISAWHLALPRTLRQFNYQTINDVIVSVSYTAEHSDTRRIRVEAEAAAMLRELGPDTGVTGSALDYLRDNRSSRLFSMRHDFSSSFTRLLHSPLGTQVRLEVGTQHFPAFLAGRELDVTNAIVVVRGDRPPGDFSLRIDDMELERLAPQTRLGDLYGAVLPPAVRSKLRGLHTFQITAPGAFAVTDRAPGDVSAVSDDRLLDLLLFVEYQLRPPA